MRILHIISLASFSILAISLSTSCLTSCVKVSTKSSEVIEADKLFNSNKYTQAAAIYKKSLESLSESDKSYAEILNKLIQSLMRSAKYKEASKEAERLCRITKAIYGNTSKEYFIAYSSYAESLAAIGEKAESLAAYKKLLPEQEKALGKDNPSVMETIDKIVHYTCSSGQKPSDEEMLERLIKLRKRYSGENSRLTLGAQAFLAKHYFASGQDEKCKTLVNEMLKSAEKHSQPLVIGIYLQLAKISKNQNKTEEACQYLHTALDFEKNQKYILNPNYLPVIHELGQIYFEEKKYKEAANIYKLGLDKLAEFNIHNQSVGQPLLEQYKIALEKSANKKELLEADKKYGFKTQTN